jgi:hypothetical protein
MKTKKINITENVRGYKNISLKLDTYSKLFDLSQKVFGVPISIAKTVEFLADNYVNGAQVNNHVPSNYNGINVVLAISSITPVFSSFRA